MTHAIVISCRGTHGIHIIRRHSQAPRHLVLFKVVELYGKVMYIVGEKDHPSCWKTSEKSWKIAEKILHSV